MKRIVSPFDPSRKAYLELLRQEIYSANTLTAASPERKISFFPVPSASQGDVLLSNINDNKLASPKLYMVQGFRLHPAQNVPGGSSTSTALVDSQAAAQATALVTIIENYYYNFFVGTKDYKTLPAFAMASGLGLFLFGTSTANAQTFYTASLGQPLQENFVKLKDATITIPPLQEFKADLNMGNTTLASFAGNNRRFWNFIVGLLGRECQ